MDEPGTFDRAFPVVCGAAAAVWVVTWQVSLMIAETVWGRPSSTSAIGWLFVPVWGSMAALLGSAVGLVLRAIVSFDPAPEKDSQAWRKARTAVLRGVGIAVALGVIMVLEHEAGTAPGIIQTTPEIERLAVVDRSKLVPGSPIWEGGSVSWDPPTEASLLGTSVRMRIRWPLLSFAGGTHESRVIDLSSLDYLTRIDMASPANTAGGVWTAVALTGRATGRRVLVVAVSDSGQVLHAELFERAASIERQPLAIVADSGVVVMLNGVGFKKRGLLQP
jgi:hypothetical protein